MEQIVYKCIKYLYILRGNIKTDIYYIGRISQSFPSFSGKTIELLRWEEHLF